MADGAAIAGNVHPGGDGHPGAAPRRRIVAIMAASSGNLVEWFDFYIYAFCAVYFAPAFFPKADPTGQLLNTAGVFAAGFIMRPLGGWLFGRLADRRGRRAGMTVSILTMGLGSLAIAWIPTHASIGTLAPILLLLARLLQGLSVGGEYGTAATYMSEVALAGRRGFYSSFQYVTLIGGQLCASLVLVVLQQVLSETELYAWGWRVPFVIGAAAALLSLTLRLRMHETSSAEDLADAGAGSLRTLWRDHRGAFLVVLAFTAGGSLIFYAFTTYMQKFLVNSIGMSIPTASTVMTAALFVFMCVQPLFGALSDRIGRRRNMLLFGTFGTLAPIPLVLGLRQADGPIAVFALITAALCVISFYTSVSGIVKAELFPAHVRALGVGFAYALANALFGGTAEYAALAFKAAGYEMAFYGYVTAMMVIVLLASTRLPRDEHFLRGAP